MKDKNWEDQFKKNLYSYESQPPKGAFEAIMNSIKSPQTHKLIWLWVVVIAFTFSQKAPLTLNKTNMSQPQIQDLMFAGLQPKSPQKHAAFQSAQMSLDRRINFVDTDTKVNEQQVFTERKSSISQKHNTGFFPNVSTQKTLRQINPSQPSLTKIPAQKEEDKVMSSETDTQNSKHEKTHDHDFLSQNETLSHVFFNLEPFDLQLVESVKRRRYESNFKDKALRVVAGYQSGLAQTIALKTKTSSHSFDNELEVSNFEGFSLKIEKQIARRWSLGIGLTKIFWNWQQTYRSRSLHPRYESIWSGSAYDVYPIYESQIHHYQKNINISSYHLSAKYLLASKKRVLHSVCAGFSHWRMSSENEMNGFGFEASYEMGYQINRRLALNSSLVLRGHSEGKMYSPHVALHSAFAGLQLGFSWLLR
jgi:hypothetical protein